MCKLDHSVHLAQQETNMLNAGNLLFTRTHNFYILTDVLFFFPAIARDTI